jgi:hypothetical protein
MALIRLLIFAFLIAFVAAQFPIPAFPTGLPTPFPFPGGESTTEAGATEATTAAAAA